MHDEIEIAELEERLAASDDRVGRRYLESKIATARNRKAAEQELADQERRRKQRYDDGVTPETVEDQRAIFPQFAPEQVATLEQWESFAAEVTVSTSANMAAC